MRKRETSNLRWVALLPSMVLVTSMIVAGAPKAIAKEVQEAVAAKTSVHPLDPLSKKELASLKEVMAGYIKSTLTPKTFVGWAQLKEPTKEVVLAYKPGDTVSREAFVVAISPENKKSYELTVDFAKGAVTDSKEVVNLQPQISSSEYALSTTAIDESPEVAAAFEKRGFKLEKGKKLSEQFYFDPYAPGDEPFLKGTRSMRVLFADPKGAKNAYGSYIEGLIAFVDLTTGKVSTVQDFPGHVSNKEVPHDIFNREILGPKKTAKAIKFVDKTPTDLVRTGNLVKWNGWNFRFSFNQREGLVLHQISFQDGDKLRSICYRASISEMLVPYSSPAPQWLWREFFDSGEYGLGSNSTEVRVGKELPSNAITLDAILPGEDGAFTTGFENRIFFFERDAGPLLMHKQWTDGRTIHARDKQLVVGSVTTLGNYDYMFQWVFRLDGSFNFEADLHGLILNKTVSLEKCEVCTAQSAGPGSYEPEGEERFGTVVAENTLGVHHQHWINLRMDFDIDGPVNAIKECSTKALPEDPVTNPNGRAFMGVHKIIGTEKEATSDIDMASNRTWVIYNPAVKSSLGHPAGYEIVPGPNTATMMPKSRSAENVGFTSNHFWATQFKKEELYAAGTYVNQSDREYRDVLPSYAGDESVYKQDVVTWYNVGYSHVTKPEDFPIMPAGRVSVHFAPKAFFVKSPSLGYATAEEPPK
jgi:primary-amine oxidase